MPIFGSLAWVMDDKRDVSIRDSQILYQFHIIIRTVVARESSPCVECPPCPGVRDGRDVLLGKNLCVRP